MATLAAPFIEITTSGSASAATIAPDFLLRACGCCRRVADKSELTALSRNTIKAGICELQTQVDLPLEEVHPERVRRPGGGRHPLSRDDSTLLKDLEALVEPATRGDPQSPLRWTSKSTRKLAAELNARGHEVSHVSVADLLHDLDYSLQASKNLVKTLAI